LIASEALRSDIISVERAITNSERASQIIATADSALGQVSGLLNDIRGLVTEAANTGALSDEQITANQLQVDSSLEALNRIAQTTSFQGRRLLDGSMDFIVNGGTNYSDIVDLQVDQASLDSSGTLDVEISVVTAATQAEITNAETQYSSSDKANATLDFGKGWRYTDGTATIDIFATSSVAAPEITVTYGNTEAVTVSGDELQITLDDDSGGSNATEIVAAINSLTNFAAVTVTDGTFDTSGASVATTDMVSSTLKVTSDTSGPDFNEMNIEIATSSGAATAAAYDASKDTITITIDSDADEEVALSAIATAIDNLSNDGANFSTVVTTNTNGRATIFGSETNDNTVTAKHPIHRRRHAQRYVGLRVVRDRRRAGVQLRGQHGDHRCRQCHQPGQRSHRRLRLADQRRAHAAVDRIRRRRLR